MAAEQTLRIYVNVPQVYSLACKPGVTAELTYDRVSGTELRGKDCSHFEAIDPASRTLLVEVDVDNRKGELVPGAYAQVHFKLNSEQPTLHHSCARADLPFAGTAGSQQLWMARQSSFPSPIGRDDGRAVEVIAGLQVGDQVIQNPPTRLWTAKSCTWSA